MHGTRVVRDNGSSCSSSVGEEAEGRVAVGALRRRHHAVPVAGAGAPEPGDHLGQVVHVLPEPHAVGVRVRDRVPPKVLHRRRAAPRPEAALRDHAAQVPGAVVRGREQELAVVVMVVVVPAAAAAAAVQQQRAVGAFHGHRRHRRRALARRRSLLLLLLLLVVVMMAVAVRANVLWRWRGAVLLLLLLERHQEGRVVVVRGVRVHEVGARLRALHGQRGAVVGERRLLRGVERAQPVPLLGRGVAYLRRVPAPRPPPHAQEPPGLLRAPPPAARWRTLARRRRRGRLRLPRRRCCRRVRMLGESHHGLMVAAAAATASAIHHGTIEWVSRL
jgi:hypothetical protein